jgi:hypothetical protein
MYEGVKGMRRMKRRRRKNERERRRKCAMPSSILCICICMQTYNGAVHPSKEGNKIVRDRSIDR